MTTQTLDWEAAAGMPPAHIQTEAPLCALVPDRRQETDQIAVVYDKRQGPPKITVNMNAGCVQTICANGVAVAVIASASAPTLTPDDVLLIERAF